MATKGSSGRKPGPASTNKSVPAKNTGGAMKKATAAKRVVPTRSAPTFAQQKRAMNSGTAGVAGMSSAGKEQFNKDMSRWSGTSGIDPSVRKPRANDPKYR